jgi:hypothetical protein
MDISMLLAGFAAVITIIGTNVGLISWLRADMKSFENRIESKLDSWKVEINKESKDFHGCLCSLEARWYEGKSK